MIITNACNGSISRGQTGHALGGSGMTALRDFWGDCDLLSLKISEEPAVDEIAGFTPFMEREEQ